MGGTDDSGREAPRAIDAGVRERFLAGVRDGMRLEEAARKAGVSLPGLYGVRRRDADFAAAWVEALAVSGAEERAKDGARCAGCGHPLIVAPNNRRRLQVRRMRHVRFTAERRETFLAHFAGTCDMNAAAEAAGVDDSTVHKHRRLDPDFADACNEALQQGYARLEAEAVRQRLEAQRKLQEGVLPEGEVAAEFERVMKLLARWERKGGRIAPRDIAHGRQRRWTFEEAILALEKKLNALNIPIVGEDGRTDPRLLPTGGEGER